MLFLFLTGGCNPVRPGTGTSIWENEDDAIALLREYEKQLHGRLKVNETVTGADIGSLMKLTDELARLKNQAPGLSKDQLVLAADSMYRAMKLSGHSAVRVIDSAYITPAFLEKNRRLAVHAVASSGWRGSVSVENFYEYILPYKLSNEIADNWRDSLFQEYVALIRDTPAMKNPDSLYNYHIRHTYYSLSSNIRLLHYYPAEENYSWLNVSGEGDCSSRCRYAIYHLRAAGIPATYDYIPNWGNRPKAQHAYVGLANKKQQLSNLLENCNDIENIIDNLNAANIAQFKPVFAASEVPVELTIQYEKTIPKVYRQTWSHQPQLQRIIREVPPAQLYRELVMPNMADVTNQYLKAADVTIRHDPFDDWKIAYLATFDISGWTPVAFATFNWFGLAHFKDVGKNILYLPMACKNQKLLPIGHPFILGNDGRKLKLVCNDKKKINMKLIRKFPLFSYTAAHIVGLKGCIISGSDYPDFIGSEQLAVIDHYPFFVEKIKINSQQKYRYLKIESPEGEKVRLAYLACFSDSCGIPVKQNDIRYLNGELTGQYWNLFDDDLNTFAVGRMLWMDLGSPRQISEIHICPRNDTNYIIPGNRYELFYWDQGWRSAGEMTAGDYFLEYTGVPSGIIYWLRCLSEGREERVFTYEGGKQIWW